MNYEIRELTYDTISDYMKVNTQAWQETYRGIINDIFLDKINNEIDNNIKKQQDKFYAENKSYKRYILYVDNKAVGMFSVDKCRLEQYSDSGEILSLYLLNEVKGRGYGKIIFKYALNELLKKGYKSAIVCCLKLNPSNEFYKHMGCQYISTRIWTVGEQQLDENIYYIKNIEEVLNG